mgnify:CR=1 FL=1
MGFLHAELSRDGPGLMLRDVVAGDDPQILALVRVVRAVQPDVLVLAGVDWDLAAHGVAAVADAIGGYPHRFTARPNRGVASGLDLNGDGRVGGPEDDFGFAEYPGQDGLAVLSKLPLAVDHLLDFSELEWSVFPGGLGPPAGHTGGRLSTTAHWDLPVILPDGTEISLLIWHATPPVFDGPEDRNGRRNHDEAAFWSAYLDGHVGPPPGHFVLMGAANLDVLDGDGRPKALRALLSDRRVQDVAPRSAGGEMAAARDGGANVGQLADPALDTVDWPDGDGWPGNLRVDYVLPSANMRVLGSGVYWPDPDTSLGRDAERASRHRLVWVDIAPDAD